ncbi:hypothetical protein JKP88DRAFT_251982 [Tribonema minus]|uniref:K Homology domain-containing protein n=1 Tax=Tribonema minus TaxID=303371 RepID=A0A835ZEM4_9STRA|nr:hypothetical protein JKP88DRAFT_251982 [Tribonema minus]
MDRQRRHESLPVSAEMAASSGGGGVQQWSDSDSPSMNLGVMGASHDSFMRSGGGGGGDAGDAADLAAAVSAQLSLGPPTRGQLLPASAGGGGGAASPPQFVAALGSTAAMLGGSSGAAAAALSSSSSATTYSPELSLAGRGPAHGGSGWLGGGGFGSEGPSSKEAAGDSLVHTQLGSFAFNSVHKRAVAYMPVRQHSSVRRLILMAVLSRNSSQRSDDCRAVLTGNASRCSANGGKAQRQCSQRSVTCTAALSNSSTGGSRGQPACAIKLLVSNNMAGGLIGKAGATIQSLQAQTGALVNVSSSACLPGILDRVVLISGDAAPVKMAVALVLHTVHDHARDRDATEPAPLAIAAALNEQEITQRLLIPAAAGGLVIGWRGSGVQALSSASGARVSLSHKRNPASAERVMTIHGALGACRLCIDMLLDVLRREPAMSRYLNLSVDPPQLQQGDAPAAGAPSSAAQQQQQQSQELADVATWVGGGVEGEHTISPVASAAPLTMHQSPTLHHHVPPQHVLELPVQQAAAHPQHLMSAAAAAPLLQHPSLLAGHHVLDRQQQAAAAALHLQQQQAATLQQHVAAQQQQQQHLVTPAAPVGYYPGGGMMVGMPVLAPVVPQMPMPMVQHPDVSAVATTIMVSIPDALIGVILGRGGVTVNELQMITGARISVSRRGNALPGTTDRVVTITGSAAAAHAAQYMMMHRVQEACAQRMMQVMLSFPLKFLLLKFMMMHRVQKACAQRMMQVMLSTP